MRVNNGDVIHLVSKKNCPEESEMLKCTCRMYIVYKCVIILSIKYVCKA